MFETERYFKTMPRILLHSMIISVCAWTNLFSQTEGAAKFDVASVKVSPSQRGSMGARGGPGTSDPTRLSYSATTLAHLLTDAYGVKADQVQGPSWLVEDRYAIEARVPPGSTKAQTNVMLQALIGERFGVKMHREMKDFRIYELVIAKSGPKMKPTAQKSEPDTASAGRNPAIGVDSAGHAVLPPGVRGGGTFGNGVMRMAYTDCTMAEWADALQPMVSIIDGTGFQGVGRVVDKTNLTGKFDIVLEFAIPRGGIGRGAQSEDPAPNASDPTAPSLFTAIENTLGLKLVATKAQLETLVIDYAERIPSAN